MIFKDKVFLSNKIQTYFPKKYCATKEQLIFWEYFFCDETRKVREITLIP